METTEKAIQNLVFEPYVEIERGIVVQQLTSNKRKCLQRPSKSCCVVIGYIAFICILVGILAMYEVNHARHTTTTTTPTSTTTLVTTTPAITNPITITKKLDGITEEMVDILIKAIGDVVDRTVKKQHGPYSMATVSLKNEVSVYKKAFAGDYQISETVNGKPSWKSGENAIWYTPVGNNWLIGYWNKLGKNEGEFFVPNYYGDLADNRNDWKYSNGSTWIIPSDSDDVIVSGAKEGTTKTELAKSIASAIKEKWSNNDSWNVIVTSTPEGEEGKDAWGSFVNPVEQKYLKLQLGDHLYCEIWKAYSRTPTTTTTTTITPTTTTTTSTTTTTPVTTKPENPMQVTIIKKSNGISNFIGNLIKEKISAVVASAEEGTSKSQLAVSIQEAIQEKLKQPYASWNVIVTSTREGKEGDNFWGSLVNSFKQKYLKLQLGDKLYFEIWRSK